jgi:hypothetical protein
MPTEADACRKPAVPKLQAVVVSANLRCTTRLRQSILQKAFTGDPA